MYCLQNHIMIRNQNKAYKLGVSMLVLEINGLLTLPWEDIYFKIDMYWYGKMALLRITPVVYYISLNSNMFLWFNFWNILNICISNINTWIAIIKFGGHHASKVYIIYSNGGHIGFNYTHTSLTDLYHHKNDAKNA